MMAYCPHCIFNISCASFVVNTLLFFLLSAVFYSSFLCINTSISSLGRSLPIPYSQKCSYAMQNTFSPVAQAVCSAGTVIKAQIAAFFSAVRCDLHVIQQSSTARTKPRCPRRVLPPFISAARFRRYRDANKKGTYALAYAPPFSLFFNGSEPVLRPGQTAAHGHAEGVRPHMAADAEGQRISEDVAMLRERVHRHLPQSSSAASS